MILEVYKAVDRKKKRAIKRLEKAGIELRRTKLGQACFVPLNTIGFAEKSLFPDDWSIAQLRAIADYMDLHPDCTIFDDGSGDFCQ